MVVILALTQKKIRARAIQSLFERQHWNSDAGVYYLKVPYDSGKEFGSGKSSWDASPDERDINSASIGVDVFSKRR